MTVIQFLITFIVSYALGYMTVLCFELHGIRGERRVQERKVRSPYITLEEYIDDSSSIKTQLRELNMKIDDIYRREQVKQ